MRAVASSTATGEGFDVHGANPYRSAAMLLGIVTERMPVGWSARFTGPRDR